MSCTRPGNSSSQGAAGTMLHLTNVLQDKVGHGSGGGEDCLDRRQKGQRADGNPDVVSARPDASE
eukprot:1229529-Alexandrium_andersonii.AAC.1